MSATSGLVRGPDGRQRCGWAVTSVAAEVYLAYHDQEWGRAVRGDDALFERLSLEAFQSGLSWLTILRKRPALRVAFAQFRIEVVAGFDEGDVRRLLADAGIVRNRAKIEAVIDNARLAAALPGGLSAHLWSFAPRARGPAALGRPASTDDVAAVTPESLAMARDLRGRGFRFVGPTTTYALMQAIGMVDDHLEGCWVPAGEQ